MKFRLLALILVLGCLVVIGCKGMTYKVPTEGMAPTINVGDGLTMNPWAYKFSPPERFDIVAFRAPDDQRKLFGMNGDVDYVQRIIGLPGETIEIKNNQVFIDGKLLDETFEKKVGELDPKRNYPAMRIPDEEFFLMGDNRPNSMDSRYFNPATIKKSAILSQLVEIYPGLYKEEIEKRKSK